MKTIFVLRAIAVPLLGFFLIGATDCPKNLPRPDPLDPEATKRLIDEQNATINALKQQADTEKTQRSDEQQKAAKAASCFQGVLKAAEYMPASLPKDAVIDESKLGVARLPPDDPQETVLALQRVVLIVTGQRDAAMELYNTAMTDLKKANDAIKEREKALATRETEIAARESKIIELTNQMNEEQKKAAAALKNAFDLRDQEIQKLKDEQAAKERRLWVSTLRVSAVAIVVAGIAAIAISQGALWAQGGLLILGGALLFGFGITIDLLTSQWWFPYAAGVVVLLVLAGGGWWIYELWKTHRLNDKLLAAVQDIKDTSEATGSQLWNQAREHFVYRLGDKDGYWGQVIQKKLIQQGLIAAPASAPIVAPSTATPAKQS